MRNSIILKDNQDEKNSLTMIGSSDREAQYELFMNLEDYPKFVKTIEMLFDAVSVEKIRAEVEARQFQTPSRSAFGNSTLI